MTVRDEAGRESRQRLELDWQALLHPEWGQLAVRFAFGAVIALAAGVIGLRFGHRVGGVFLAFPAILPAALTLLERSDGTEKTDIDAVGASLGAVALLLFAITAVQLVGRVGPVAGILIAAVVWIVAALALYPLGRAALARFTRQT